MRRYRIWPVLLMSFVLLTSGASVRRASAAGGHWSAEVDVQLPGKEGPTSWVAPSLRRCRPVAPAPPSF
jgi:hypothetical protein